MNSLSSFRIMWNSIYFINSLKNLRNFSAHNILMDSKPTPNTSGSVDNPSKTHAEKNTGTFKHKVSNFDKWILVMVKKYPSKDKIPKYVADDVMQHAMSKARIRTANVLMILTVIVCIYTVVSSKNVQQQYIEQQIEHTRDDYRKQITEEYRQKIAEQAVRK